MENLDAKIEEALQNEISYNYAMSTEGDILKGPPDLPPLPSFIGLNTQTNTASVE